MFDLRSFRQNTQNTEMLLITHLGGRWGVGGNKDVERITVRSYNVVQEYPDVADNTSLRTIDTSRRGNIAGERITGSI